MNITYFVFVNKFFDKDSGMGDDSRVDFSAKECDGRYGRKIIQMGLAVTVGGSETRQRYGCGFGSGKYLGPLMFTANRIVGIPHVIRTKICFQVVNVPMEPAGNLAVTCNPGLQASRAEGAADVDIISGFKLKGAEFSDRQIFFPRCREDHCVCAGERAHD